MSSCRRSLPRVYMKDLDSSVSQPPVQGQFRFQVPLAGPLRRLDFIFNMTLTFWESWRNSAQRREHKARGRD
jgi:hypothetical protein